MKNPMVMTIAVAVIVGAAAFFGGMKYQQSQQPSSTNQQNGGRGGNGGGRQRNGGGRVVGDIISQDDKSITVKMQDGSTKIILLSGSTSINTASQAAKTDLKVGTRVGVFGTDNSDGSVTAQNVQINPMMMRGFGGGQGANPSASPTSGQ